MLQRGFGQHVVPSASTSAQIRHAPTVKANEEQDTAKRKRLVDVDVLRWICVLLQGLLNQMIFTYYIASTSTTSVSEALELSWQKRLVFVVFFLEATGFAILYFNFFKRKFKRPGTLLGCISVRWLQVLRLIAGGAWIVTGIAIAAIGPNTEPKTHNVLTQIEYVGYSVTEIACILVRIYDTIHFESKFMPSFVQGRLTQPAWIAVRSMLHSLEITVLILAWVSIGLFFGGDCSEQCKDTWEYVSVGMQSAFVLFFVLE